MKLPLDRDLDAAELLRLAAEIAADERRWRPLVRHDPGRRTYEELRVDAPVGVWVISWMHSHDTGFHDHDISSGAVHVVAGAIRHERLRLGGDPEVRVARAGEAFTFDCSEVHRMSHWGDEPAVTIHLYSPPLWRMGAYEVDQAGMLRRHSISYAEELRPIEAAG